MNSITFKSSRFTRSLITASVIAAFGAGAFSVGHWIPVRSAAASVPTTVSAAAKPAASVMAPDFTGIVERNGPAVVNISVTQKVKTSAETPQFQGIDPDDPFFQFFRHFGGQIPFRQMPQHGLGSGFIVSPDGVILTNAHVVADASEVTVKLTDKREFQAKVVGSDKLSDVAVLKIDAHDLPTVKLGSGANLKVGEWVLAIGSPFGFENSVTSGIVSAKSRSLPEEGYVPFIQTDVAVNPGNSGGPLFNMKGEVVGINSQIYTRSGGYQGLSFAIPIDLAVKVKDQLQQFGKVSRGRLGVTIQDVNQPLAESFGLKTPRGALVSSVEENSPAARAGLKSGDVVLEFNGKKISNPSEFAAQVADLKPGSKTTVQIWRNGSTKNLDVTVGELKGGKVASTGSTTEDHGRLGLAVRPLTPEESQQVGSKGLVVESSEGAAARAGIRPGDVLLSINGKPIASVDALRGVVSRAGKTVALLVQRDESKIFVPVELDKQG